MKVLPFIIPKPEKTSVVFQTDQGENLYDKLHQHEEIQLSCMLEGEGSYYIGDRFGHFEPGEIYCIGQNLPHVFNNDPQMGKARMISLFFTPSSYGESFFELPEFRSIREFLRKSEPGIRLTSNITTIRSLMKEIGNASSLDRFIKFMELLGVLGKSEYQTLSSSIPTRNLREEEGKRMRDIMDFTLSNFERNISVSQVADVANLTPNAFCRYFKQRTNKTYIHFLSDIRIGQACNLLSKNEDLSISEIAHRSGFNNLTNFNRKFKQIKGFTPSEFRKKVANPLS